VRARAQPGISAGEAPVADESALVGQHRDRRVLPALAGALVLDLVFSAVELTVRRAEAVLFLAVDLVLVGLIALVARRHPLAD
jgi:hypothetical protein